jgi:uncharacterized protein (TIGR00730 family)
MPELKSIAVFCGSADGVAEEYLQAADEFGQRMAGQGIRLVYGAGKTGMMGAVAEGVLRSGGEVVGVVNESLNRPNLIHAGLTRLEVVADLPLRKARMVELADAIVALPGGYGTWDELFEVLTLIQIGSFPHPVGILNPRGYYDPLLAQIALAGREGFIWPEHLKLFVSHAQPEGLLAALEAFQAPGGLDRWLTRPEDAADHLAG